MNKFKEIIEKANEIVDETSNKKELKEKIQNLIAEYSSDIIKDLKEGE